MELIPAIDLRGAKLSKANLIKADLNGADLFRAVLKGAKCNAEVVLPKGFSCKDGLVAIN